MKIVIAEFLREIAANIEEDDTPYEINIGDNTSDSNVAPPTKETLKRVKNKEENQRKENEALKYVRKTDDIVTKERVKTSPPKQKPSRKNHGFSAWKSKDKRKDYQKEYRENGRELETGNSYVKKYKPGR